MPRQVVIDNPILNSPYAEPSRHWRFSDEGITNEPVESRRVSSYFMPIAQPKRKDSQLSLETEWTKDREQENKEINRIRRSVSLWRDRGYPGITKTTARLLSHWTDPDREQKLFFCQIEALETCIYLTEAARKEGETWVENFIRECNEEANPGLFRIAFKMATGSGKTVVMAMLIAWHSLNKLASPQDARFSDAFLIVAPGITIRDRLRVLLPSDPENYYSRWDLLPQADLEPLGRAKVIVTNFHSFMLREKVKTSKLNKQILSQGKLDAFTESPGEMVRRVCRELRNKKNIVVINDEGHHCYRHKVDGDEVKLKGDERKEAEGREKNARVWISGLVAIKNKIGLRAVYDLSATPFFLRGSGYREGNLFPWVVSDFSLIDAIESGIVKVPRVPVSDDSVTGTMPTYREIWSRIRDELPRKGRRNETITGEPTLPAVLEGALQSLYKNYEKSYERWLKSPGGLGSITTPPVFIVVCNNTSVSKLVFDYVAGWEKKLPDGSTVLVPGKLSIFSNVEEGVWTARPNSVLIDSEQLESGEAMSRDFKKIAAPEIAEFKADYRQRFPGRDPDKLTDEDLLREVMNTVGKKGKLGENVKCVVSVSMLTEGWDANTVSHILGVRAFGTQLLCEQVVGRGLRRRSYILNDEGKFDPEYAEVYGVPFSFIPCAGTATTPKPPPPLTRVRALEERIDCEITFPRVAGYRYDLPAERVRASFTEDSKLALSTADIPTKTLNAPIVGEESLHTLDDYRKKREKAVAFRLARLVLEKYFRDDEGNTKHWLFPDLVQIAADWMRECLTCKDNTFPQLLLVGEFTHDAADRIHRAIAASEEGEKALLPLLKPYNEAGSTRYVDFNTARPVYETDARFCHVSHVVADTQTWEQKTAQVLEDLGEEGLVISYVKNQKLGFIIPYTIADKERHYYPDFIALVDDGRGRDDPLHLIIEVTGLPRKDKAAKVATARNLWIPAVNNHGGFGRWGFVEIDDPWGAKDVIRGMCDNGQSESGE